ncbi:hypothetical protein DD557_00040 [Thalassobacter stenotrophicus]|nr:hypothetical protein DD557_00040 [Thalassobacter stenotrophicus]
MDYEKNTTRKSRIDIYDTNRSQTNKRLLSARFHQTQKILSYLSEVLMFFIDQTPPHYYKAQQTDAQPASHT